MYIAHLVLAIITIISSIVLIVCLIKKIGILKDVDNVIISIVLWGFIMLLTVGFGLCAYDESHYRENNEPDWEDYKNGKAEMQTLINQNTNDTANILVWKGKQTGER